MEALDLGPTVSELRLGASLLRTSHTWMLAAVALGLPLLVLAGVIHAIGSESGEPLDTLELLQAMWAEVLKDPAHRVMLWIVAALLPVWILSLAVQRRAWIRVTPTGLEGYVPRLLGGFRLQQTTGRWSIRWDDVRRIRLVGGPRARNAVQQLASYRLIIETAQGETRLSAFCWFEAGARDHRLRLAETLVFRKLDALGRLSAAPLVRAAEARGLQVDAGIGLEERPAAGYDLARHKGMLAQVALFFGAGLYALADTFIVEPYLPLGPLPVWPFAVTAAIAAFGAWRLGRGAPALERLAVGVLAVAACVAAAYPAMLRLNAATAEVETVVYMSSGEGRFEAPDDRFPPIDLSARNLSEYWTEYPPGTEHEFTLLSGKGGFHQLRLAPLYERTRRFYGGC